VSLALFFQHAIALIALSIPALDRAIPFLLREMQVVPSHSMLHVVTGLVGFAALYFGGSWPRRFALGFGVFYIGLAIAGALSGRPLGLGLKPFDHPFHTVIGGIALLVVAAENLMARAAARRDA
jgi:hypothetical protein